MYRERSAPWAVLLVPALLTTVAYVDPGNFGSNIEAGSVHGYDLLWVVALASVAAGIIQYLAALLGLATGQTLATLTAQRMGHRNRLLMWLQAEVVVLMTDLAELVGGALGLYLLFGIPLPVGACIVGVLSLLVLATGRKAAAFSAPLTLALLGVVGVCVLAVVAFLRPSPAGVAGGLVPGGLDASGVLLVVAIVGATVMPHALYFHSAVSAHTGHRPSPERAAQLRRRLGLAVAGALGVAACVNGSLLLIGAVLPTHGGIEGAHTAIAAAVGNVVAVLFGVALLASGVASTVVGVFTGQVVMEGYIHRPFSVWLRRLVGLVPPLVVLALGVDPTWALVVSQVVLALALPITLVPLVLLACSPRVMGPLLPGLPVRAAAVALVALITIMDAALVYLVLTGQA